jgi:hypothetical protein
MVANNFIQRISYQGKVIDAKTETAETLSKNVEENIPDLTSNVNALTSNTNLERLRRDQSKYSIFQVVVDSVPMFGDQVALGASLQREILPKSGVTVEQIQVVNGAGGSSTIDMVGSATSTNTNTPTSQTMTFSISVSGSYNQIQAMLKDIERTIRPISINTISIQGTNDNLSVTINAITYFIPKVNYVLGSKEIKP